MQAKLVKSAKFSRIKNDILGKNYSLSIAYVTPAKSRELNKKYRKKDKATNVLSFALRRDMGELLLCAEVIKKEAKEKKFGKNLKDLIGFLVIHGMLHLKGLKHSSTMEKEEEKYDKKYFSRNRRRVIRSPRRGGRVLERRNKS
ncbi:MAG: rRNA maturation RNase YbeY [bacterium]|nr:rRNA maturation RNase YbeY [bacterium]